MMSRISQFAGAGFVALALIGCSDSGAIQPARLDRAATPRVDTPAARQGSVTPTPAPEGALAAAPAKSAVTDARPEADLVTPATGVRTSSDGAADGVRAASSIVPTETAAGDPYSPSRAYREVTIPAGTILPVELRTTVASDASHVEEAVRGTLRRTVSVRGTSVLPAGTVLLGHVTDAARSARVKGRARVAFRFTALDMPGEGGRLSIHTASIARRAPATKKADAAKIGGGAAGGAVIGGILGGGSGAAKGAAIGGAAGTGVVLSTRGREVRVPAGTSLSVRLTQPLTVRVPR
jgi:hypothetical protein